MERTMGEPFYGTGKPPEGWKDGDYVEVFASFGWNQVKVPIWHKQHQYRLEANHPFYKASTMTDAELIEQAAKAIFEHYEFGDTKKPSWVVRGNSTMQCKARAFARAAFERLPQITADATELTDEQVIALAQERFPDWNPPALPDRAETLAKGWHDAWVESGEHLNPDDKTYVANIAIFIARKLIAEGVLK